MSHIHDLVLVEHRDEGIQVIPNGKWILRLHELRYRFAENGIPCDYTADVFPVLEHMLGYRGLDYMGTASRLPGKNGFDGPTDLFGNVFEPLLFVKPSFEIASKNYGMLLGVDADHPMYRQTLSSLKLFMGTFFQKAH